MLHRRSLPWTPNFIYPPTNRSSQFRGLVDLSNLMCLAKNSCRPSANLPASSKFETKTINLFSLSSYPISIMASSSNQIVKLQTCSHFLKITFIKILESPFFCFLTPNINFIYLFPPQPPDSRQLPSPSGYTEKSLTRTPCFHFCLLSIYVL